MENNLSRLEARWKKYDGFGAKRTNADWARELGLARHVLWRYLQRGLTIEQVVELRGIDYPRKLAVHGSKNLIY